MTPKAAKLNELVDAIPGVCSGGRDGIRNLVAEITGEKLVVVPESTYHVGQQLTFQTSRFILAGLGTHSTNVVAVNLETGRRLRPAVTVVYPHKISASEMRRIFGSSFRG